jgi:hypothetical protein
MKTLEENFIVLLTQLGPSLTDTDVEQIQELVDANELGVAFENFCTQLFERNFACSREQLNQISSIGAAMGISPDYWKNLETA